MYMFKSLINFYKKEKTFLERGHLLELDLTNGLNLQPLKKNMQGFANQPNYDDSN